MGIRLISTVYATMAVCVSLVGPNVVAPAAYVEDAQSDCAYPYVCLYNFGKDGYGHKTGQFRDFTSGWQYLTKSRGDWFIVNTRNDDVVRTLRNMGGTQMIGCVGPNKSGTFEGGGLVAIRIDPASSCGTTPVIINSRRQESR